MTDMVGRQLFQSAAQPAETEVNVSSRKARRTPFAEKASL